MAWVLARHSALRHDCCVVCVCIDARIPPSIHGKPRMATLTLAPATILPLASQLPHETLARFETTFNSVGAEKEKRNAIKNLVAQAGGEEVRKLLASVSKVQVPGAGPAGAVAAAAAGGRLSASGAGAKTRTPPSQADADAILQGAIFNAIFT